MLSAILLLLQLWDSGAQETDNERSAQGTSAPLLPLLQRFQSIICSKDMPHAEGDMHVSVTWGLCLGGPFLFCLYWRTSCIIWKPECTSMGRDAFQVCLLTGDSSRWDEAGIGDQVHHIHKVECHGYYTDSFIVYKEGFQICTCEEKYGLAWIHWSFRCLPTACHADLQASLLSQLRWSLCVWFSACVFPAAAWMFWEVNFRCGVRLFCVM